MVRGLDYYTRTVFEFPSQTLGFALGGGGRYDGLVEEIGGPSTPALGFGLGMDRLMLALKEQHVDFPEPVKCEVYIAAMGPAAQVKALTLVNTLHSCGVPADCDICGRGLKAQMKYAGKTGAKFSMVLGEDELASGKAVLKDMSTGETRKVDIGDSFVDDYLTFSTQQEDLRF